MCERANEYGLDILDFLPGHLKTQEMCEEVVEENPWYLEYVNKMKYVNKVVLSDKMPCNNGRDWRHIVGYQVDGETIIALFIKTSKNIFSYGILQYGKNSSYTMSLNVSEAPEWVLQYKNIWNEVKSQLFAKLPTGLIKGEGK